VVVVVSSSICFTAGALVGTLSTIMILLRSKKCCKKTSFKVQGPVKAALPTVIYEEVGSAQPQVKTKAFELKENVAYGEL